MTSILNSQVLQPRTAYVGHLRPELLPVPGAHLGNLLELLVNFVLQMLRNFLPLTTSSPRLNPTRDLAGQQRPGRGFLRGVAGSPPV